MCAKDRLILFCDCMHYRVGAANAERVREHLGAFPGEVLYTSDLCGWAVQEPEKLQVLQDVKNLVIIACHSRAVRWLLHRVAINIPENTVFLNYRSQDAEHIIEALGPGTKKHENIAKCEAAAPSWVPWFPVIDYQRCNNCGQCMNFCLFGVYEKIADQVTVVHPDHCKTNCPACARICPAVAIIFPKLQEEPINGANIIDEEIQQARVRVDVDRILGDDPYQALQERRRRARERILRKKALDEREKCRRAASISNMEEDD